MLTFFRVQLFGIILEHLLPRSQEYATIRFYTHLDNAEKGIFKRMLQHSKRLSKHYFHFLTVIDIKNDSENILTGGKNYPKSLKKQKQQLQQSLKRAKRKKNKILKIKSRIWHSL